MPFVPAALPRCTFYLQVHGGILRKLPILSRSLLHTSSSIQGVRRLRSLSIESPVNADFSLISSAISPLRKFSGSAMAAAKIDGTAIAKSIRQGLKSEIEQIQVTNPRFKPNLVIFQGKRDPLRA